eukprot:jgi/Chlat1/6179/Chrsp42S05740
MPLPPSRTLQESARFTSRHKPMDAAIIDMVKCDPCTGMFQLVRTNCWFLARTVARHWVLIANPLNAKQLPRKLLLATASAAELCSPLRRNHGVVAELLWDGYDEGCFTKLEVAHDAVLRNWMKLTRQLDSSRAAVEKLPNVLAYCD